MSALDELYGGPLEDFMERRKALGIKKAGKPTQAAHALNQLVRHARKELEELFEAGRALASGKDFKASIERQRAALEAVRKKATGPDVPAIIAVIQGALVDPKLAEAVKLGQFVKLPEVPVGFFGAAPEGAPPVVVPKSAPRPAPAPAPPPPPPPPKKKDDTELKAAEKEVATLTEEVSELERELLDAKRRLHEASTRAAKLKAKL